MLRKNDPSLLIYMLVVVKTFLFLLFLLRHGCIISVIWIFMSVEIAPDSTIWKLFSTYRHLKLTDDFISYACNYYEN